MAKIIIYLGDPERDALNQLAQRELRAPRAQAALIIRRELTRLGMLSQPSLSTTDENPESQPQEGQP
jgi:hypothetical protein